jgi:hypothetical protein
MWKAYLFIYLLQLCDFRVSIITLLLALAIIAVVVLSVLLMNNADVLVNPSECEEDYVGVFNRIKKAAVWLLVSACLIGLFPNKQTIAMVGGLYLGNKAVQAISGTEVVKKVDEIVNLQLDKIIVDMKEEMKGAK